MKMRWAGFEDQVRDIAAHVYGKPCTPRRLVGSDVDGVIDLSPTDVVLIEITTEHKLDKVRRDSVKLVNVRNALFSQKKYARCLIILQEPPTQGMIDGALENNIDVMTHNQFAAQFLEYERYRLARVAYPFGSAIDPESGKIDTNKYVPVPYIEKRTGRTYSHKDIGDRLLSGKHFVVLGEYGSGKSRCVSQVFDYISQEWGATFRFPVAVNLRECWGLEDADEILRRHFTKLALDDMKASAVKAYNRKAIIFLLDGFDEIGIQSWSADASKIREVRAQALSGVQDAAKNSGNGILITGREHYFSSDTEMLASLGLKPENVTILHVKEEFSLEELLEYFKETGIDVTLPDWLPRRPLICQTIAQLNPEDRDTMFGSTKNAVTFWRHFMTIICERDARINKSFNADTIYDVFVKLANLTRTKPGDVGPINPRELQDAFEGVVGALPVENAAVMLQRLPSLGRVDQDSTDRQFIDTYILDGLRAVGVTKILELDEGSKREVFDARWSNPLQELGQMILAKEMDGRANGFINLAQRAARSANHTLGGDVVASAARSGEVANFEGVTITDAAISELDLEGTNATGFAIQSSTIDQLVLPSDPIKGVTVRGCAITKVAGASSEVGLPSWMQDNLVEEYDSVRTMSRIRDAGLDPAHEVLVVIVKKTFFQPGTGRKEEALLRGFEAGKHNKVAKKVISSLVSNNVLGTFKGKDGTVYTPNRAMTARVKQILEELRSSQDPIWTDLSSMQ